MEFWEKFTNYKERGEWVELQFMSKAAQHRLAVTKPWGDTRSYDVGIEHAGTFLRVQVKSTTARSGCGYTCAFIPHQQRKSDYSLDEIDLFAAYVIPEDVWYLIPAAVLLGKRRKSTAVICPVSPSAKKTINMNPTAKHGTSSRGAEKNFCSVQALRFLMRVAPGAVQDPNSNVLSWPAICGR